MKRWQLFDSDGKRLFVLTIDAAEMELRRQTGSPRHVVREMLKWARDKSEMELPAGGHTYIARREMQP